MDEHDFLLLRNLLREQRLLALAVVVEGEPVAGLVPFLASPDLGALVVHVSGLARHSRGLGDGAAWSGVVHRPDADDVDPLLVPRVLLHGHSRRLEDGAVVSAVRHKWLARFPSAAPTVQLPDFAFVSLDLEGGRLIGGAGQARNLSAEHFSRAAGL